MGAEGEGGRGSGNLVFPFPSMRGSKFRGIFFATKAFHVLRRGLNNLPQQAPMDRHADDFFQEFCDEGAQGLFHRVIALHKCPDIDWETLHAHAPVLPRGWYELSRLSAEDRLEFIRGFWVASLPFLPSTHGALESFFNRVDDIGVYITQDLYDSAPDAQLVYSLSNDSGFFRGFPPATEEDLEQTRSLFQDALLPADYAAFLKVHNGFGKYTDTGVTRTSQLLSNYKKFQDHLALKEPLTASKGELMDVTKLIPFYESFGLHCYQCFWSEWYPEQEMGNVYYSGIEHSLADHKQKGSWSEKLAFPTFLDWLVFYLESVE